MVAAYRIPCSHYFTEPVKDWYMSSKVTQEPIKTGGLRLSALDDYDVSLPFEQRFLWKRGEDIVDSARDDSEGVAAVLKSSKASDVAFMDAYMPVVNGSEAMNKLCQHEAESAATDKGDHERRPSHYII